MTFKKLPKVLLLIVLLKHFDFGDSSLDDTEDPIVEQCLKAKCNFEGKPFYQYVRNGTFECVFDKNQNPLVVHPCYHLCAGYSLDLQTKTKCWCAECLRDPRQFCDKPYGMALTTEEECNDLVCSGKGGAQHRNEWCVTPHPESRKEAEELDAKYGLS